jgi:hypothetical protein
MTLGRTSTGAIKTKTDGGLRAVNCACCGGCNTTITEEQFNAIRYGGTANIAANTNQVRTAQFYQNYEYSYVDQDGATIIFGELNGNAFKSYKTGDITNCVTSFPPPMQGTYSTPFENLFIDGVNINIFYGARIPLDSAASYTIYSIATILEGLCKYCDGTVNGRIKDSVHYRMSGEICGHDLYAFLMEANTSKIIYNPFGAPQC